MGEIYYLVDSGKLEKNAESLNFVNSKGKKEIPIETVESLLIFGNVSITKPVISLLAHMKIPVIFYSMYETYISSLYPENYLLSGSLLVKQSENYSNKEKRILLARKFVEGAARNMAVVARRGGYNRLDTRLAEIRNSLGVSELMGIEGNIHRDYFSLLDEKLPEKFRIEGRQRRPPGNRMNALISFLNSILYGVISSQIYSTHLHPSISFLHEPFERRSSLTLDISEIFKPIICDRVALKLVNLKTISEEDFVTENGTFLNDSGRRKVLKYFDEKINETVFVNNIKRKTTLKYLIRLELYKIEKHILGDQEYKPYILMR